MNKAPSLTSLFFECVTHPSPRTDRESGLPWHPQEPPAGGPAADGSALAPPRKPGHRRCPPPCGKTLIVASGGDTVYARVPCRAFIRKNCCSKVSSVKSNSSVIL